MEIVVISDSNLSSNELDEYAKRINKRVKFSLLQSDYKKVVKNTDYLVVLDQYGEKFDNLSFAKKFEQVISSGNFKRVVFIVGDAYGLNDEIKEKANLIWSFSDQVFPHRLFGLMLTEQIYRTIEIISNSPYHHQ
ncbi:MAG: 23S rRNA (pseudouridine(1915)-N(3))-methyltransferase RlmH [Candidatus Nomurabacteria bacterium]|nr:MAG: 23S rRNA (pseudouridine(1915)-N(3))-methyltransferase RlmH [Candidatus Nomurabacteria bacterium]HRV76206.1 23S rRNA (pseudouridine(1915)-N(3))-methyltransferase RlmH [Candidatus Saccharimonadales bacterium]